MFATSRICAFWKIFPAAGRYGSAFARFGSKNVELRVGSVWYLSVWYFSHSFDVRYVMTVQAASLFFAFLGMPMPQPPRTAWPLHSQVFSRGTRSTALRDKEHCETAAVLRLCRQ